MQKLKQRILLNPQSERVNSQIFNFLQKKIALEIVVAHSEKEIGTIIKKP